MSDVKRWDFSYSIGMHDTEHGEYVDWDDYSELRSKVESWRLGLLNLWLLNAATGPKYDYALLKQYVEEMDAVLGGPPAEIEKQRSTTAELRMSKLE